MMLTEDHPAIQGYDPEAGALRLVTMPIGGSPALRREKDRRRVRPPRRAAALFEGGGAFVRPPGQEPQGDVVGDGGKCSGSDGRPEQNGQKNTSSNPRACLQNAAS